MLSIYALTTVLILTLAPFFNKLIVNVHTDAVSKYGAHEFLVYDLSGEDIQEIVADAEIQSSGTIQNYGQWQVADSTLLFTLGKFDEGALALSHVDVLEGRLPSAENEIALERNTLYRLPEGTGVGSAITVTQNESSHTYTVVGLLSSYVGIWSSLEVPTPGVNDLPHMLVYAQPEGANSNNIFLYTTNTENFYTPPSSIRQREVAFQQNANLSLVYLTQVRPLRIFHDVFYVTILIGCAIGLYAITFLYIDRYQKSYSTMQTLGATNGFMARTYLLQQLCLLLAGIATGFVLSVVVLLAAGLATLATMFGAFGQVGFIRLLICIAIMFAVVIYSFYKRMYTKPVKPKKPVYLPIFPRRRKRGPAQLKIGRFMSFSLAMYNFKKNFKKIVPVILLIVLLFSVISFTQVYFSNMLEGYTLYEDMPLDFRIGTTSEAMHEFNLFDLEITSDNYLPTKDVLSVYDLPGVSYVETRYATGQGRLLVPSTKEYFWTRLQMQGSNYETEIENLPSKEDYIIIEESLFYKFVVLTDSTKQAIQAAYPNIDFDGLKEDEMIAFLPEIPYGKEYVIKNKTTLHKGDLVRFGRIATDSPIEEAIRDLSLIRYEEFPFTVKEIVPEQLNLQNAKIDIENNQIIFVLSEEAVLHSPYFKGVKSVDIYLDETISEEDYAAIDDYLHKLSATTNNIEVYSYREEQAQNAKFKQGIRLSMYFIVIILGVFTIISLFSILYMALLQRKRSYATFRALGMEKGYIYRSLLMEVFAYLSISMLLSLLLYLALIQPIFKELLSLILDTQDFLVMLGTYGVALIIASITGVIITNILTRSLYKGESIISAIRVDE